MVSRAGTAFTALVTIAGLVGGSEARAAAVDPRLYSQMHWRLVGPFRAGWAEMIEGVPAKPQTYYFGAAAAIYRSTDAGKTLSHPGAPGQCTGINHIASDPGNPRILSA